MYEAFYGLREKPFTMTPNPRYFYDSTKHKDALSSLLYTIQERRGFAVITGEIGSGKTTVCRTLLGKLDQHTKIAIIRNTQISPKELIQMTLEDLEIPFKPGTKAKLILQLNEALIEELRRDVNIVLLIDEAQNLVPSVLEEVRMLSNLETDSEKLIQILLIGQPELWETLSMPRLRQFKQRIAVHCHLTPLDIEETRGYVEHRLRLAGGAEGREIFAAEAIQRLHEYTHGVPRLINAVADRALLISYVEEMPRVTPATVDEAAKDIPAIGDAEADAAEAEALALEEQTLGSAAVSSIAQSHAHTDYRKRSHS